MGGRFVLELGEFGADRGAAGEVTDDEGRRGIGREVLRFPSFPTFLPADHDMLDDYGTALTHGIPPGIPF